MIINSDWITYITGNYKGPDEKYGNPSPYFRKDFTLNKNIKKAELIVSALAVFKVYINGKAVCDDYLSPGWVDYSKKLPFMRYDVTSLLGENNAVGVVLGDGWAVGHIGSNYTFKRCGYSDIPQFTLSLLVEYENGDTCCVNSDKSWKATDGAIRRSDIYMGEYIDNRLNLGEFSVYGYDDSHWNEVFVPEFKFSKNLYLDEMLVPPIKVKHRFTPVLVKQDENGMLYDVGQNISGVLRCIFEGKRGDIVTIYHGEILENNRLYTENLRKAEATDTFVLSGSGDELFRPLFTYHGFRYALISFTGDVKIKEITAEAMYSDLDTAGEFSCENKLVNQIYKNALWGQRDNFLNVPTDCPQRDERLGWTGDAQIFCKSAMYNMDCRIFYKKYLADIRDAQLGNGVIPAVCPLPHVGYYDYTGRDAAAGWCEAIAEIPYNHYLMYGDKAVLRENLYAVKKLIDYYLKESPSLIRRDNRGYGEWLSLGTPSDLGVISTLYFARVAYLCCEMCKITEDSEVCFYLDLYERIKKAFLDEYVNENGVILSDTQSVYLIAHGFGIISLEHLKMHLLRKLDEDGGKLTTGFLGIKFLLPALCEIGRSDIAYNMICSQEYPGWGYSVVNGATTIWEHWDSYTHEKGVKKGMNSFNHYSFGSCTEWMYEYVLGISPQISSPGFKSVKLKPYIDFSGKIGNVSGYYNTDFGRIVVSVTKKPCGIFEYSADVPTGIEYEFEFPDSLITEENHNGTKHTFLLKYENYQ